MAADTRQRRLLAASIAKGYGHGGIKLVSGISRMDVRTIRSGIHEIDNEAPSSTEQKMSGKAVPEGRRQSSCSRIF